MSPTIVIPLVAAITAYSAWQYLRTMSKAWRNLALVGAVGAVIMAIQYPWLLAVVILSDMVVSMSMYRQRQKSRPVEMQRSQAMQ